MILDPARVTEKDLFSYAEEHLPKTSVWTHYCIARNDGYMQWYVDAVKSPAFGNLSFSGNQDFALEFWFRHATIKEKRIKLCSIMFARLAPATQKH